MTWVVGEGRVGGSRERGWSVLWASQALTFLHFSLPSPGKGEGWLQPKAADLFINSTVVGHHAVSSI